MQIGRHLHLVSTVCVIVFGLNGTAQADQLLPEFARALGFPDSAQTTIPDGKALTFWSIGLTEDAARLVFRVEMDDAPCKVRVSAINQNPPNWAQMQVAFYDFSKLGDVKGFASFDDMASQKNPIPFSDPNSVVFSLYGEGFYCQSSYDLGSTPPEAYSYCEGRRDVYVPEGSAARKELLDAMSAVSKSCDLKFPG